MKLARSALVLTAVVVCAACTEAQGTGAEAQGAGEERPGAAEKRIEERGPAAPSMDLTEASRSKKERADETGLDEEPSLRISAVGDCTIGTDLKSRWGVGSFHVEMQERGGDLAYPFSGVVGLLSQDDLTIANLETTLTTHEPREPSAGLQFRGDPAWARMLVLGSVEAVSVANNHAYDLGRVGFEDTVRAVQAQGVGVFGFGLVDRRTIKGIEVVNLGYTGGEPSSIMKDMVRSVSREKRPDNLVIVSFHWGGEGVYQPNGDQIRLGRGAIDAGADLVLGHHPHVIQGIETYRGREIVYSLGNFVFGGHSNPEDKDTIIYQATFQRKEGRVVPKESQAIPARVSSVPERNDYRPVLLDGAEKARVLEKLRGYSAALAMH
ncbi:CapA family protein [Chondromyces crocatus]|uniref:Capsular polysaccharide biosynthesis protein n=1 Tax=Chondromyces crocatus TaxID=52 RepID=A0A0K1E7N9_CHOCO|nr:CapA family protein [Chondromyces crocatus]AKT36879.1 capsular polysaccharide biosynthesis protein [Chondromyces crocatus]